MIVKDCFRFVEALRDGAAREQDVKILCTVLIDVILPAAAVALGEDLDPAPLLVDTREQDAFGPFLWRGNKKEPLEASLFALREGDYTTPAAQDWVRIERKSIPDLYGTLFSGTTDALGESAPNQERFRRELLRLGGYPRAYIVVEGRPQDLTAYIGQRRRRVNPTAAIQLVEALSFDYGVPVRWCTGREGAEWFTGYVLSRAHAQATSAKEAKKAAARGLSLPWAKKDGV